MSAVNVSASPSSSVISSPATVTCNFPAMIRTNATPVGSRLYASRGWQLWQGPSAALTPDGITRTADHDGAIYVLPVSVPLDLTADLTCDYRPAAPW